MEKLGVDKFFGKLYCFFQEMLEEVVMAKELKGGTEKARRDQDAF